MGLWCRSNRSLIALADIRKVFLPDVWPLEKNRAADHGHPGQLQVFLEPRWGGLKAFGIKIHELLAGQIGMGMEIDHSPVYP